MTGPQPGAELARLLDAARARRMALLAHPETDVCRLFNSTADGIPGLVIEKYGPLLVAQLHEGRLKLAEDVARELCAHAAHQLGARAVYRKVFPRDRTVEQPALTVLHRDPTPWIGTPAEPELTVREHGVSFLVRPYDGYGTGLFLDHRTQRVRVRALAPGRRVLNAFAYTCGFTVAAALGGATATVSVDASKKRLEWGRRNMAANGLPLDNHRFICSDIFDYYRRARRQGHRFDMVILDPPTFGRAKIGRRPFVLADDLERLAAEAMELLAPGGYLHLSVNRRDISERRLHQVIEAAARRHGRRCEWTPPPPVPDDLRGDPGAAKCVLAQIH